ncbi:MAG TPA: hypothetical protein EYP14_11695 [Planctomycetaceae bacterium]|nr:hypothetical protein [Planctomycetaceae bacterium]
MTDERRPVRIPCAVPGHEQDWIEFDASGWTLADVRAAHDVGLTESLARWVETDSTAWHLTGDNGPVPHPGRGAPKEAWMAAYEALGQAGLALYSWLAVSPVLALNELLTPPKKSATGSAGGGQG